MSHDWPPQQQYWPNRDEGGEGSYGAPDAGYGYPAPNSGWQQGGWQAPRQPDSWDQGSTWGQRGPMSQPQQHPYTPHPYAQHPYDQYSQDPYAPHDSYGYGRAEAPEPRRGFNLMLPVVLVLVLLLVVGGGAYAFSRLPRRIASVGSATPTPATTVYSDDTAHIHFAYPSGWVTSGGVNSKDGFEAYSPDQKTIMVVGSSNVTVDKTAAADAGLNFLAHADAANGGKITNKQGPANVSLVGETWVREGGDFTFQSEAFHGVVLVTNHGGRFYMLAFLSTPNTFSANDTRYFQPMMKSFAFIK